jgi:hypothetical protein
MIQRSPALVNILAVQFIGQNTILKKYKQWREASSLPYWAAEKSGHF